MFVRLLTIVSLGCAIATPLAAAETTSGTQPPPATDVQGGGSLSDKLSTTSGVIHPTENADPGIAKAPPATGNTTMPVIPPPGTPGGDPAVKPK